MLTYKELVSILAYAVDKYAREEGCGNGWKREDIWELIQQMGGDESDLYAAMAIGINACTGGIEKPGYYYS